MRKKKIVSISLIMSFMVMTSAFVCFVPQAIRAEDDLIYGWNYSQLDNYSFNDWGCGYAGPWGDNYLISRQSYNISNENDFLGLLSQGVNIYVPPGASFGSYGGLVSPGGYLPAAQWPAYSYATPSSPFGMYEFQPYPGGPIVGSLKPMTREEWWQNQIAGWDNPEKFIRERWPNLSDDELECRISFMFPIWDRPTVPPWEEQPILHRD